MNKLEQAARQALEALEEIGDEWGFTSKRTLPNRVKAITALREALVEPQIKSDNYLNGYCTGRTDLLAEQAEQEPVGYVGGKNCIHCIRSDCGRFGSIHPACDRFFAAPVRTKDLTDDEIEAICADLPFDENFDITVARAVIAADREKNK